MKCFYSGVDRLKFMRMIDEDPHRMDIMMTFYDMFKKGKPSKSLRKFLKKKRKER